MNSHELTSLFDEWRDTTHAEGEAISNGRWNEVAEHQAHKRDLQRDIVTTTEAWQREWPRTGESQADYEGRFRPMVSELISLEARNASLIDELRATTQSELRRLDRNVTTLRGVQRAYGAQAQMHWASYS